MTDILKLMNRIPRRYRNIVRTMLVAADAQACSRGMELGKKAAIEDAKKSKEGLRVDISMSIQRLADSNAQIATTLVRALDKL